MLKRWHLYKKMLVKEKINYFEELNLEDVNFSSIENKNTVNNSKTSNNFENFLKEKPTTSRF